ncbi:class I SAM-dependent methyltransferase [Ramlibacter ginsenosidimutans]|uniref:Class I SAM-dependent methyltransferase n=1 Tax=Ramlibacter ginsenosidimutans TaxID=502333 RepID=A0A934TU17_9BURK|nr:class I SAM-dependent methyltransferase [Ramlibacter ginsenosidimutans]MBK6007571.1 class I SAM-dependent methyltransferase [Ramlibacter ginsenosidimutans]
MPDPNELQPPVHLPHAPLPSYYRSGDAAARETFIRTTFDDTAVDYDRLEKILGLGTGSWYRGQALLRAGLKPGMQVVDVGMGTGLVTRQILKITGEPQRLIGVDPSPGMMKQAHFDQPVECRLGRAEEIPVATGSADFLVMGYALRHIADFAAAAAEFRRVLKPGGRLLLLEITRPQGRFSEFLLKTYMRGMVPTIARLVSRSPSTPMLWRYYWDTIEACVPPAQVIHTLREAGLAQVERHVELGIFSEYTARVA